MRLLCLIICDVVIVTIVSVAPALLRRFGSPPIRGFFCDDETIRYPYMESTVSIPVLYWVGIGTTVITIILTEIIRTRVTHDDPVFLWGVRVPSWVVDCYKFIGIHIFGGAFVEGIGQGSTFTIGRLRPNFIDVCVPDVNCTLPELQYKYITDYKCLGTDLDQIEDSRLSFPSGHACYASYTALFLVFYIQGRWHISFSHLLKHTVQLVCILLGLAVSLSRIHDNEHHWSDVVVGLIVGVTTATFMTYVIKFSDEQRTDQFASTSPFKDNENFRLRK